MVLMRRKYRLATPTQESQKKTQIHKSGLQNPQIRFVKAGSVAAVPSRQVRWEPVQTGISAGLKVLAPLGTWKAVRCQGSGGRSGSLAPPRRESPCRGRAPRAAARGPSGGTSWRIQTSAIGQYSIHRFMLPNHPGIAAHLKRVVHC